MRGFRLEDRGFEVFLLFMQSYEDHPAIDFLWYGFYNDRTMNLLVNAISCVIVISFMDKTKQKKKKKKKKKEKSKREVEMNGDL